jgi:hypothetical protein
LHDASAGHTHSNRQIPTCQFSILKIPFLRRSQVSADNMKSIRFTILLTLLSLISSAQYPFEAFDSIHYDSFNNWVKYDWLTKNNSYHQTLTLKGFYQNQDSLTVRLSSFPYTNKDSSYIRIFRNKQQIQKIFEPMRYLGYALMGALIVADFNNDSLQDLKLNASYMSCGLGMHSRIVYLLQTKDGTFKKISFDDNLEYDNRCERDFGKNGKFEIITMTLNNIDNHNYLTFDLFEFEHGELKNADDKFGYPIMIQLLNKPNYQMTKKISKERMKDFKLNIPRKIDFK